MIDKQLFKLALNALELVNIEFVCNGAHHAKKDRHGLDEDCPVTMRYRKAITALKERLAQTEQEPVAWRETHGKVIKALAGIVNVHTPDKLFDLDAIPRDPVMGLVQQIKGALDKYKPPPQRTWVGLTEDERDHLTGLHLYAVRGQVEAWIEGVDDFAQAIEAKLKEKNT